MLEECDPDELSEMIDNAREFLDPFGQIVDFQFLRLDPPELRAVYQHRDEALIASQTLDGLVMGGESIHTTLLSDLCTTPIPTVVAIPPSLSDGPTLKTLPKFSHLRALVTLYNAVKYDEVQDDEEAQEILRDITCLCQPYGAPDNLSLQIHNHTSEFYSRHSPPSSCYVQSMDDFAMQLTSADFSDETNQSELEIDFPVALLKCTDLETTVRQADLVHGRVISGSEVQISLYDYWSHEQAIYRPENVISLQDLNREASCGLRFTYTADSFPFTRGGIADITITLRQLLEEHYPILRETDSTKATELIELANNLSQLQFFLPSTGESAPPRNEVILFGLSFRSTNLLFKFVSQQVAVNTPRPSNSSEAGHSLWFQNVVSIDVITSLHSSQTNTSFRFLTVCHGSAVSLEEGSLTTFCEESVLVVGGFVTTEDLQDTIGAFPEEMIALKRDLFSLLQPSGDQTLLTRFYCRSCVFITSPHDGENICYHYDSDSPIVTLRMEFSDLHSAEEVMYALNGTLLGGETLICELFLDQRLEEVAPLPDSSTRATTEPSAHALIDSNLSTLDKTAIPKLPKHTTPSQPIPVSESSPSPSSLSYFTLYVSVSLCLDLVRL
jgi:hypothetical protein